MIIYHIFILDTYIHFCIMSMGDNAGRYKKRRTCRLSQLKNNLIWVIYRRHEFAWTCFLFKAEQGLIQWHYSEVIMSAIAFQITIISSVFSTFVQAHIKNIKLSVTGLCDGNPPVGSTRKGPVTRKMFPFDDVIIAKDVSLCCSHGLAPYSAVNRKRALNEWLPRRSVTWKTPL